MSARTDQRPTPAARDHPRIVVVGDSLIDVVVRPRAVVRGADRPAVIRLAPGGQGANVAVRLARRGLRVRLVAALGHDPAAALLVAELGAEGVELDPMPAARTGAVVVLLDRAGERTMLSDRAPAAGEPPAVADALRPRLAGAGWIHVSGYALLEPGYGAALSGLLREAARPVSADGGSVHAAPDSAGRLVERLRDARVGLFFASRTEAEAILDPGEGSRRGRRLSDLAGSLRSWVGAEVAVVTDGGAGSAAAIAGRKALSVRAAAARRIVDTTGAGDAYAAAVIGELVGHDRWPPSQAALRAAMGAGSRLAGQVVAVLGAQGRVAGERSSARAVRR